MRKKSLFAIIAAVVLVAAVSVCVFAAPAAAAELSERTLKTDNVSVKGKFEDIAVLTAYQVFDSEAIVSELINRNQIRNKKQIIAIYNVTVTGEQEPFPVYTISIEGVKLNPLAKNKVAVIDSQGAYYSIKGHNYNRAKQAISFKTDTLGDFVIYSDMTLFYVIAGLVGLVIIMVIALKMLDVNRYKKARQAAKLAKEERGKKSGW
ncbi:MAG TPA: hypothetical protein PLS05_03745 [Clostridia bacterium]|nr:hypothetical protein [Clostridia bacterium]HOL60974.1 hypothetical protein [Clostridia bacterium]HPO53434.1 hypothetical protein [Clostridia bacterium]